MLLSQSERSYDLAATLPVNVAVINSPGETEEGCLQIVGPEISVSEGDSPICMQSNCYHARIAISSPSLQSTTVSDEFCASDEWEVQYCGTAEPIKQSQSVLVAITRQEVLVKPITPTVLSVTIESNASSKGWGAVLNGQTQTGGVWSTEEGKHHINYLELLAAFLALQTFGKNWRNTTIILRLNNITAVKYINQKGGTTSTLLCQLTITVWTWCMSTLTVEYLPGHLNTIADQESWSVWDHCDWMLNPSMF